jgi:SAM-dependent methyltransferase
VSSSWSYLDHAVLPLLVGASVLDVGCGMGRWGTLIETNYWEAKLPAAPVVDGLDVFAPNVEHCRRRGAYRRVWAHTLPDALEGRWDTVLAGEVLEHLPADAIEAALEVIERAARRRVILTTPNGPAFRGGHDTPTGFNPFEAHISAVDAPFLRRRGYVVRGVGFGRYDSRLAVMAKRYRVRTSLTFAPWRLPRIAETLVAYKDLG